MKSKTKTKNDYAYQPPPPTTMQQAAFDQSINAFDNPDPSIPFAFGNMRAGLNDRFDDPYGADYSPEVRDAIKYSGNQNIDQIQGAAVRDDRFRRQQAKSGLLGQSAGMMAPQLTQVGGTSTQSQAIGPQLIAAAASMGSAALT